jgi:ABC-type glucose/galactose transport system permease subunit
VRTAVVLVLAEAAALTFAALGWLVRVVAGATEGSSVAWFLLVFVMGVAGVLVLSARTLRRGARGGRAPVVTWQLLQAATAVTVLQGGPALPVRVVAVLALVVGAVVVGLLLSRSAVAATAAPDAGR